MSSSIRQLKTNPRKKNYIYLSLIDYKFRKIITYYRERKKYSREKKKDKKKKEQITNKSVMEVQAEKRPPPAGTTLYLNFDG